MTRDESWELAAPNEAALAEMKEHCHQDHGAALDPSLHISYANHHRHEARIAYLPGGGGKAASFECLLCDPPKRFLIDLVLDYSDPGAQRRWMRENPSLADEIASCEMPEELIGAAIDAYVFGKIPPGGFAEWRQGQRKRRLARRRPQDAAREDGCMRFLLERRLEGLTVEKAIEALIKLQVEDPEAWRELSGGERTVTEPTLERYWRHIPLPVRKAAEAALSEDGGASPELKERLLATLSPSGDLPQSPQAGQARGHARRGPLPPPGALKDRGGPLARRQR